MQLWRNMLSKRPIREASVGAVVLRCTCGNPASHAGQVCPQAREEPRGVVAYYHRDPFRRLAWWARSKIRGD